MKSRFFACVLALALLLSACSSGRSAGSATEGSASSSGPASSAPSSAGGSSGGSSASESAPESGLVTFRDGLDREVSVAPPERVAALIGSFADVWNLAGGGDTLVAAASLRDTVADLGPVKEPDLETLLAARPDLVLASTNTQADVDLLPTLESAGIPVAFFDIQTFEDYCSMLEICTRLTGHPEALEQYGTQVQKQVETAIARQDGSAPTVLCMRATGSSCKVKGSEDFVLGEMLADLGCVNVADQDGALLEDLSLEAILAADPDYIFVVLQGADATRAQETLEKTLLSNPAWQSLRAVQEDRFYTLEHRLYNLKPNARWGESYEKLADILYPGT